MGKNRKVKAMKSYLFAGISIFCWSTAAVVAKVMMKGLTNFQLLFVSAIFAGLSLLIFSLLTERRKLFLKYRLKDFLIMILCGLPGTFLYYVFFYAGTDKMPLASQALIVNYLWPIMSVLFACIILKEKLTGRKIVAFAVSFLGVAVVAGEDILNLNKDSLIGALFCILGAVSYGIYTALNRKVNYDKFISLSMSYFTTAVITCVIISVQGKMFLPTAFELGGFFWNGVFAIAVANVSWLFALTGSDTARISNLAYMTPFISLVWSGIFLKEKISIFSVIGLIIIILGIFIQLVETKKVKKS